MKIFITLSLIIGACSMGYSQTHTTKGIQKEQSKLTNQILTLSLDLNGVSKNDQGALKDDFLGYNRRIISLDYDEHGETMIITYSELSNDKITFLLDKYSINSSAIINE